MNRFCNFLSLGLIFWAFGSTPARAAQTPAISEVCLNMLIKAALSKDALVALPKLQRLIKASGLRVSYVKLAEMSDNSALLSIHEVGKPIITRVLTSDEQLNFKEKSPLDFFANQTREHYRYTIRRDVRAAAIFAERQIPLWSQDFITVMYGNRLVAQFRAVGSSPDMPFVGPFPFQRLLNLLYESIDNEPSMIEFKRLQAKHGNANFVEIGKYFYHLKGLTREQSKAVKMTLLQAAIDHLSTLPQKTQLIAYASSRAHSRLYRGAPPLLKPLGPALDLEHHSQNFLEKDWYQSHWSEIYDEILHSPLNKFLARAQTQVDEYLDESGF